MEIKNRRHSALAVALITFGSLVAETNATVLISWSENGDDVIATLSGFLTTPLSAASSVADYNFNFIGTDRFAVAPNSDITFWSSSGTYSGSALDTFDASSSSGNNLGFFSSGSFFTDSGVTPGQIYNVASSITFSNQSFLTMFGSSSPGDSAGPSFTFQGDTDPSVSSTFVIPEPSSALFLGLGALGLAARRRSVR